MNFFLQNVRLLHPESVHHLQTIDIIIQDGRIQAMGPDLQAPPSTDFIRISQPDLHVSAGWFDLRATSHEPGHESQEDLDSLARAAKAGGFTDVALLPNTHPVTQTKSQLLFFTHAQREVRFHPMAAVTLNTKGTDFTDMMELAQAGALAFSDGSQPIWNADILLKTLQYLAPIGKLLINRPDEVLLRQFGQMHEGMTSTRLGMKGIPPVAEELMIQRDLALLRYANIASAVPLLHFSTISTAGAVALIREAKKEGLPVSCDIASYQLSFTDEDLVDFDTHLKVMPPFRGREHREALIAGLLDGTIDTVVSNHQPWDEESKKLEFDLAEFGIIHSQTAFAALHTEGVIPLEQHIQFWTHQSRKLVQLPVPTISPGQPACLTLFLPNETWQLTADMIHSKSKNSPFLGKTLRGKVVGTIG